ncbi:hypothetical protein [Agromyces seonyuensis]|uniref:Uncharacterized protein n=1 Tax=Agromyces seonyuensis TaxID=2662446 RepID=A0A6I4NV50_9MICO|nr:hypothetical protein [Agromyces seonyuensis]MWB96952.1 hypothetical protein [Agromyces seonyuensis]
MIGTIAAIGLLLGTSGCVFRPPMPTAEQLVGEWIDGDGAVLTLDADGTFTATQMPEAVLRPFSYPPATLDGPLGDGAGSWQIGGIMEERNSWGTPLVWFSPDEDTGWFYFEVINRHGEVQLRADVGDPESVPEYYELHRD